MPGQNAGSGSIRRNGPSLAPRRTSHETPLKVFRLDQLDGDCFQQLTGNSNRTLFRLGPM